MAAGALASSIMARTFLTTPGGAFGFSRRGSMRSRGCRQRAVETLQTAPKAAAPTWRDSTGTRESKEQPAPFPNPDSKESRISVRASRLILGVLRANVLLNLSNLQPLIMHFPRIQSDILADVARGSVLILEAKQIVLVTEVHHASAEAWELFQNLWNVFRHLISGTRLRIGEKRRRHHVGAFNVLSRIVAGLSRAAQRYPRDGRQHHNCSNGEPHILLFSRLQ